MRNQLFEQALAKQGVTFRYEEKIPLEEIDAAKSLRNQARLVNPLEDALVEDYLQLYKDHFESPPLVLWRPGRGRWLVIDGNHRLAACLKLGKKFHDAYVVECDDQQVIDRLTWTFNNLVNGKRLSREESVEHAIAFCSRYGYSVEQAAKEWGVPKWLVQRSVRASHLRAKLQAGGIKVTGNLTDECLSRLAPLEHVGDDVLGVAAQAVAVSGVSSEECEALVKDVKTAKTHEAKLKVVTDWAQSDKILQRKAESKNGTIKRPTPLPRTQLARLLAQMQRLFENFPDKNALRPPTADLREVRNAALACVNNLSLLFKLEGEKEVG